MTDPISNERLLPCPFCGDPMQNLHGVIGHVDQRSCVIGQLAWDDTKAPAWNRRQSPAGVQVHKAVDAIFADLRDRRLLKWLFSERPTLIGTFADGDELRSLDADVQQEIRDEWTRILSAIDHVPGDDETYEIGKRDGYEKAIQDLDLATGGDGEFRGSTFPGETVDVPAMRARIIDRLSAEPAGVEPVAWQRRLKYSDVAGAVPQWQSCSAIEATGHFEKSPYHEYRPLYTSPPPKAVTITDEMVEQVLAWVRDDVLPAYGVSHATRASDPEMAEGARAALTAALSSEGQSNG